jgi:hypothetical protein
MRRIPKVWVALFSVLLCFATPAHAYYGESSYATGLFALLVLINEVFWIGTLLFIIFSPLSRKNFHGVIWLTIGIATIAFYLADSPLFFISYFAPMVQFVWVVIELWREPAMAPYNAKVVETLTYKREDAPAYSKWIFWILMLVAQAAALLGFVELADMSQWVIQTSRDASMFVWGNRWNLFWIAAIGFFIVFLIWWRFRLVKLKLFLPLAIFLGLNLFVGWFNVGLMFRPQNEAEFVRHDVASAQLKDSDEVSVVDINGDARAYPDIYLVQPHVAGSIVGGQEVAMTYCGLTHLAHAYEPRINNRTLDMGVFTQLENNLVLFDYDQNRPIQQIWGHAEGNTEEAMRDIPGFRMSYGNYKKLYPTGLVFWYPVPSLLENPVRHLWDSFTRWFLIEAVNYQHTKEDPVFPTVSLKDTRLESKEKVYALRGRFNQHAFTRDYLIEKGDTLAEVDGREVRLVYFEEYDSVMAFNSDGYRGAISPLGETEDGRKLEREPTLMSQIFWIVWANFYPETTMNGS